MTRVRTGKLVWVASCLVLAWSSVTPVKAATAKLYWAQDFESGQLIGRADSDGKNAETVIESPDVFNPVAMALDPINGKVYWAQTSFAADAIYRANLDGSAIELVLDWPAVADPVALAVDGVAGKLYWAQRTDFADRLMRSNLDGSSLETVLEFPDIDSPVSIALDSVDGRIYWAQRILFDDAIYRAEVNLPIPEALVLWPEVDEPVALTLDTVRGRVYWAQSIFPDRIVRTPMTGGGVETVLEWPEVDEPVALSFDGHDEAIYWAQSFMDIIARASLGNAVSVSGVTAETLLQWPEVVQVVGISLEPETEGVPPLAVASGCRYLSVTPPPFAEPVALRIEGNPNDSAVACVSKYVQAHCAGGSNANGLCSTDQDCPGSTCRNTGLIGDEPVYRMPGAWGTVPVRGFAIQPAQTYFVYAVRQDGEHELVSPPASATTYIWGDAAGNGLVSFTDISIIVDAFSGRFGESVTLEAADLNGPDCIPQRIINFQDVSSAVNAFRSNAFSCAAPCS